jgi:REase_DpnII-MboI
MSSEIEETEAVVFGHRIVDLPGNVEDLITLEKEGAIYSHFWDEGSRSFRYYRIPFLPAEIYQYVEAHVARQEFRDALERGADFEDALESISNPDIAQRVRSYGNYGHSKLRDGREADLRGCAASFFPSEIEDLVCGGRPDRYQSLPDLGTLDKPSLLIQMLDYFPVLSRSLARRGHGRPSYLIENEYDVQDLLFVAVRAVFDDARTEDWTPKHAGSSKRIDIVVPSAETVIETKIVRDAAHARRIADELKIDIESYHAHSVCKRLLAFIFDPNGYIVDPNAITQDLSGVRIKGDHRFDVQVLVRT